MSELLEKLHQEFQDEDYRYAYDEAFSNSRMATQIKVIRERREGMTQAKLAELAGMKQSRISALENVDYSAWSVSTLRRLARALGVRLFFGFESWGELLPEIESFGRTPLERPAFADDRVFNPTMRDRARRLRRARLHSTAVTNTTPQLEFSFAQTSPNEAITVETVAEVRPQLTGRVTDLNVYKKTKRPLNQRKSVSRCIPARSRIAR
jgi:transcriptional regulator with XRE-family HTH domain